MILNALEGKPLPVYGDGANVRDWLYVEDHARALQLILTRGRLGETYNVGGRNERTNLEVVESDLRHARRAGAGRRAPRRELITFVADRPGPRPPLRHRRAARSRRELGWRAQETLRERPRQDGALVSRQPRPGGSRCARASMPASGSGLVCARQRPACERRTARCGPCHETAGRRSAAASSRARSSNVAALARRSTVVALGRPQLDLLDAGQHRARALRRVRPDVVVNAAAYTAVDKAESEPRAAFAVNATARGALAAACAARGLPLIHVSTDYVFDGAQGRRPTSRTIRSTPLGVYGRTKLDRRGGALRPATRGTSSCAPPGSTAPHGHNFVRTMLRLARERPELRVVADQHGSPTYAPHLADAILAIAAQVGSAESLGHLPRGRRRRDDLARLRVGDHRRCQALGRAANPGSADHHRRVPDTRTKAGQLLPGLRQARARIRRSPADLAAGSGRMHRPSWSRSRPLSSRNSRQRISGTQGQAAHRSGPGSRL